MSEYFLGIDGGQSSTTALIGDASGRILGTGRAGPCNHVEGPGGREKFAAAVTGSVTTACRQAGLEADRIRFRAACLGFSGGAEDKEALAREIIRAERVLVTHDALIALAGATAGAPGVIVIAGTGSIAFGRNGEGKTARAGGWGYVFGDEGGAFDLVRQALRAALRFEEGWGPPTLLRAMLLEATATASANELLHRFYTTEFPRPRIAGYAGLVDEAARRGDAIARQILHNAARQLAALAGAVRGQLFHDSESVTISFTGGMFSSGMLRERFRALVELEEGNRCAPPAHPPAAGALLEAYRLAGLRPEISGAPHPDSIRHQAPGRSFP